MTDDFEHLDMTVCGRWELLLLVGQGVEDSDEGIPYGEEYFLEDMDGIRIPDPPTRLGSGRLTIRNFSAVVHVLSPTTVRTVFLVGNFNPNLPLIPQLLLDFIMRKMCGVGFSKLQHAAKKACTDPVRNAHAKRICQQESFRQEMAHTPTAITLLGWTMPPVPVFNLTDEELERELCMSGSHRSAPLRSLTIMETVETIIPSLPHSTSAPNLHDVYHYGSAPAQPIDSASTISSVSGVCSTFDFRNNPISTQQEKAKKIEEGRQRTAARLKPKAIPEDNQSRLQQLKAAKYRKMRSSSSSLPV